jgi:hypothetical protein
MAPIDSLPGDQRAVLQLVLGRGRSYDEIARLLSINPDAVRERARAATEALGPQTRVPEANRQMICDYLLGQLPAHDIPAVRELLAHSAPERGWASVLSPELAPLSAGPLPEIPASAGPRAAPSPAETPFVPAPPTVSSPAPEVAPFAVPPAPAPDSAPVADADGAPAESAPRRRGRRRGRAAKTPKPAKPAKPTRAQRRQAAAASDDAQKVRSSRRGGMVVIAVSVIVIAAVIVVVAKHHDSHHTVTASAHVTQTNPASASQTSSSASSTTAGASSAAKVVTQINLSAAGSGSKAAAIADVLQEGSEREVAIVGQNVPANTKHNSYEVWLYNSPSNAVSLGFVDPGVTANGKLSAAGPLPTDASSYHELIITTETVAKPKRPGPIVLAGTISGL